MIRAITPGNVRQVIGQRTHWFCPTCRRWKNSYIPDDCIIVCEECGTTADLSRKEIQAFISYYSRYKTVKELCKAGSPWAKAHDNILDLFNEFLADCHTGKIPRWTKKNGYATFAEHWQAVEELGSYLLEARDRPGWSKQNSVYDEEGLSDRYYDSRRKTNQISYDFNARDEDGFSKSEWLEMEASRNDCYSLPPSPAERFDLSDFAKDLNETQRDIVALLCNGYSKTETGQLLGLSPRQLRTQIAHIATAPSAIAYQHL